MLQSLQTFWMSTPPDPSMPLRLWKSFGQEILGWIAAASLCGVALIILLYWLFARRIVIRSPLDPFGPFTPVRWLFLSFAVGLIPGVAYVLRYRSVFSDVLISPVGGAVTAFLLTTFATYLVAQLLIWLPGITPRKVLYHPRWLWRQLRRKPQPSAS